MGPSRKVVLCPGQGAQVMGMAKAWCDASPEAREIFSSADRILADRLGDPLSELCFRGPADRLNRTDISQPAIYTASVASWRGLLAEWGSGSGNGSGVVESHIAATAGLSLGEYTALHIAGAFSFQDGLELVALRGRAMQDAAEAEPSGMIALIGADEAQAAAICEECRGGDVLVCANFNAPGQVVISGSKDACDRASAHAAILGIRAAALPVAGAFHSPIMAPAAARLAAALAQTPIKPPSCPVVSNVTALPHQAEQGLSVDYMIRRRLVEQLTSPVRWAQSCQYMVSAIGPAAEYHELAPGKSLSGMMKRIDRAIKVVTHEEPSDV